MVLFNHSVLENSYKLAFRKLKGNFKRYLTIMDFVLKLSSYGASN